MLKKLINLLMFGSGVTGIEREDPVARTERMREHAGGQVDPFGEKKSREELLEELRGGRDDQSPPKPGTHSTTP